MNTRFLIRLIILSLLTLLVFTGGYLFGQSSYAPLQVNSGVPMVQGANNAAFRPLWETRNFLHEEYFDQPLDDELLAEGAIEGMLATLEDPNTRYLSPEDEEVARQAINGNIEGIGAEVANEDGRVVIVAPYEGSPAAAAACKRLMALRISPRPR